MSPRSLFSIILKAFGIYFIKELLLVLPQLTTVIALVRNPDLLAEGIWLLLCSIIMIAVYGMVIIYLLLKTDWVIDKLELDKGFREEKFEMNIHRSTVLYIILVVAGIFILISAIPYFCNSVSRYFQEKRLTHGLTNPDLSFVIFYLAEMALAILMITNSKFIVKFIELRRRS